MPVRLLILTQKSILKRLFDTDLRFGLKYLCGPDWHQIEQMCDFLKMLLLLLFIFWLGKIRPVFRLGPL